MTSRCIFLPGAGADPDFWRPVGDRLPADWGKIYLGWPGLSDQPAQPGVEGLEGAIGLVEAQMAEGPVDLLAQSMGGLIAMLTVLRHPAKVRRLVHWMLDPATGRAWASAEAIAVSFDLQTRKIVSLSDDELARAEAEAVPGLGL